ncbi:unnamed protein product, partial [Didymodactylos carnosus]
MSSDPDVAQQKVVVLAELTKEHKLNHVESAPTELLSTTQAKVLIEVTGKHHLNHIESPPSGELTEAEKQAYIEEKQTR